VRDTGWEIGSLPGPRRLVDHVIADLSDGFSCVWIVTDDLVERGVARELLAELAERTDGFVIPAPPKPLSRPRWRAERPPVVQRTPATDLPSWAHGTLTLLDMGVSGQPQVPPTVEEESPSIAERLFALSEESDDGSFGTLLSAGWARGRVVVLCGWEEGNPADVASFLARFSATIKEKGLPPGEGPRLLVAVRERDLPGGAFDRVDPTTTRLHWWWGTCGRLDTAVVISAARPRRRERVSMGPADLMVELVTCEVMAEVAGPDLVLADYLASSWDGRVATLAERIAHLAYDGDDVLPSGMREWRKGGERPIGELRSAWACGLVDIWDGQIRVSPVVNGVLPFEVDLDALVWRGQHRALMPLIDGYRAQLEKKVVARASMAVLAELDREPKVDGRPGLNQDKRIFIELTSMEWAVRTGRVRLAPKDATLIRCLRDMRNALAHHRPLTDQDLSTLARTLPESHW